MRARLLRPAWILVAAAALLAGCARPARPEARAKGNEPARKVEIQRALTRLRAHEQALRRTTRFEQATPASRALGPDPYRLCAVGERFVGVLRGSSEVVLLGRDLTELARAEAPARPTDCAALPSGEIFVLGQRARELRSYRVRGDALETVATQALADVVSPRALAVRKRTLYVSDEATEKVHVFALGAEGALAPKASLPLCRGPFSLQIVGDRLVAACGLEHALVVRKLEQDRIGEELARIVHDGPFWGVSALAADGALWIAASGVEDHPLERFGGAFGYVDSFVYLYRVDAAGATRLHALDTSDVSVLVPKGLALSRAADGSLNLLVTAYGSESAVVYHFAEPTRPPTQTTRAFLPGIAAVVASNGAVFAASPLLDRWARLDEHGFVSQAVRSELPARTASERLGEALVFTRLIAPTATSDGRKSRFTCETCHFEGGVDGRVHHTGRDDVRVTTRPLFGLLGNAPHFSRALDRDLTSVSHNEFRVAGLANPYDPWFTLKTAEFPWLADFVREPTLGPEALRTAFLDFLASFEPDDNPNVRGRSAYDELERRGAELFRERCATCHAARSLSDEPKSEVAFERWESLIFSEAGPLVWARGEYSQSGVTPYVHPRGTRIAALRRVNRKYPYFTNGSARSLAEVVRAARFSGGEFFHAGGSANTTALTPEETRAVVAFLELL